MSIEEINEAFDREYEKYKNSPEYKAFAEQEPVAWVDKVWVERLDIAKQLRMELLFSRCQLNNNQIPLYAAPPQREWIGLTDEEIVACGWCDLRFARAIEAKLKEKNGG
jgi:hypothetical protein